MKCCNCHSDGFTVIDGTTLCFNCYTNFQNVSNNNISSALQLHRGSEVAKSMIRARADLLNNQSTQHHHERNIEMNNYNNSNIVYGNNNGNMDTGKTQIKKNKVSIVSSKNNWLMNILLIAFKWINKLFISPRIF